MVVAEFAEGSEELQTPVELPAGADERGRLRAPFYAPCLPGGSLMFEESFDV